MRRATEELLAEARRRWPDQWRDLQPMPLRFATWVGYDMDGRTDISWATSLRYRLSEKAERLAGYAAALGGIGIGGAGVQRQPSPVTVQPRLSATARTASTTEGTLPPRELRTVATLLTSAKNATASSTVGTSASRSARSRGPSWRWSRKKRDTTASAGCCRG